MTRSIDDLDAPRYSPTLEAATHPRPREQEFIAVISRTPFHWKLLGSCVTLAVDAARIWK